MNTALASDFLKISEISETMNVAEATVVSWIESGELVASDMSTKGAKKRLFRVAKDDLEDFRKRRMVSKTNARAAVPVARAKQLATKDRLKAGKASKKQTIRK